MELKIERNKYSPAELTLLGVFAIGLLLSFLLVANRKHIPLSSPIAAPFDGLKNSIPSGRGWRPYEKWKFSHDQNAFILMSILNKSPLEVAAVIWKYYLPPAEIDIEEIISRKSLEGGYVKVKKGTAKAAKLNFTVLIFTSPVRGSSEGLDDCYFAVCKLPMGGLLTLEAKTTGDEDLARRSFNAAMEGLSYTPDWPPPNKDSVVYKVTETKVGWAVPMRNNIRKDSKWKKKFTTA